MTTIPYVTRAWNPMEGCSKVSEGCRSCWALSMRRRFGGGEVLGQQPVTEPVLRPDRLDVPLHWRKPRTVAVAFMGDLFHDQVPDGFIDKVFAVMAASPQHTFLLLTKRPERMQIYTNVPSRPSIIAHHCTLDFAVHVQHRETAALLGQWYRDNAVPWPLPNVWLGVSCENQARVDERIPLLLDTPAAHRWVSLEPLLGAICLSPFLQGGIWFGKDGRGPAVTLPGLDWLVVGGESGPKARPCHIEWIRDINGQCEAAGVKRYVKQMGSVWAKEQRQISGTKGWPDSKGENWDYWGHPDLRVREMPEGYEAGKDAAKARIAELEAVLRAVPHMARVGVLHLEYGDRCSKLCPACQLAAALKGEGHEREGCVAEAEEQGLSRSVQRRLRAQLGAEAVPADPAERALGALEMLAEIRSHGRLPEIQVWFSFERFRYTLYNPETRLYEDITRAAALALLPGGSEGGKE